MRSPARFLTPCSGREGLQTERARGGTAQPFPPELLGCLDWDRLYAELLTFRESRGLANLVLIADQLPAILTARDPLLCQFVGAADLLNLLAAHRSPESYRAGATVKRRPGQPILCLFPGRLIPILHGNTTEACS